MRAHRSIDDCQADLSECERDVDLSVLDSVCDSDGLRYLLHVLGGGSNNTWMSVTYGGGLFVAVAQTGTNRVMTSPDGITWTTGPTTAEANSWKSVAYGNGLFVAVAESGTNLVMTAQCPSGCENPAAEAAKIIYNADHRVPQYCNGADWVAMGRPESLPCTLGSWTGRSVEANYWHSVTYGDGLFVAVARFGTNLITTSPDGITWTPRAAEANEWYSVTYGNGLFVAVAATGTNRVMTSPDGITWTPRTAAAASGWYSVTYGNGLFVAVGGLGTNSVMTSPDGINWTARTAVAGQWTSVAYGNGQFVAVARGGTNRVMTSPDGITWTARTAAEANLWQSVAYGNGLFVATALDGTNRVMTSPDGITWTARAAATTRQWSSVTYGGGLFVAVAADLMTDQVMTSPDGINWSAQSAGALYGWISVAYGDGLFVAVSPSGTNRVMTAECAAGSCSEPVRPAGAMVFDQDNCIIQYCDGDNWRGVGKAEPNPCACGTPDPCLCGTPIPGDVCGNGSVYAGLSPDGSERMYTTPADAGQFTWNNGTSNYIDTAMSNTSYTTGEANTTLLVGLSDAASPYEAAVYCDGLNVHGHGDWYLPALDELDVLYDNHAAIGGFNTSGSVPAGFYVSSSEDHLTNAWNQRFSDGYQSGGSKKLGLSVRCVRR